MQQTAFILYGSEGCHLCELAEQIVFGFVDKSDVELVDIVDSDELVTLYGTSIPVVERRADGSKLYWPFDANAFEFFVNTRGC